MKHAMVRHLAMFGENPTDGCFPSHNVTAQNPQTCCRCKGIGPPPPGRLRQLTPELSPHPPRMPPVTPGVNEEANAFEIDAVPPRYVYIHTPLPSTQFVNLDAYAKDCKHDTDDILCEMK